MILDTSAKDWMFVFPKIHKIWEMKASLQSAGIWRWDPWDWLGHEGGALMYGVSALIKKTPESSLPSSAMWGQGKKKLSVNQEERSYQ